MAISTGPGVQPYKYTGKELDMQHGLNLYDFSARTYDPAVGRFTTMDPLAEKYYSVSPYAYCANNPIRYKDPDGRDGMVTGSGTREDPYIITANYYYQNGSLNETQLNGLNSAVSAYNNSGKNGVTEIKNADGSKSYVRYNLSAQGVDNVDEARLTTAFETASGDTRYYGNIVGTEANAGGAGEEYGSANNIRIDFNIANINEGIASGMSSSSLNKRVAIHEIGHNLGGEHSDGTSVMDVITTTETHSQLGGTTTISHSYPSMDKSFTKILINRRDVPRTPGAGRLWTRRP
jgi:RHS repeat-associated protein